MSKSRSELDYEREAAKARRRANLRCIVCLAGMLPSMFWSFSNFLAPSFLGYYFRLFYELFPGFYSAISASISVILVFMYFWLRTIIALGFVDKANEKKIVMSAVPYTTVKETPERLLKYDSELLRTTDYLYGSVKQARIFEPMFADWELELSKASSDQWRRLKVNFYYGSWFVWNIWRRSGFFSRYFR